VDFSLTEEQSTLRATARRFLAAEAPPARVRAAMETELGYDEGSWRRASAELGWPSLVIPEAYGGANLTHVELAIVMEEAGRALYPSPLFASACLAAACVLAAGSEEQKRALLPGIASGETTAALAFSTPHADGANAVIAREAGDGFVISGKTSHVVDGHAAKLLVIEATAPARDGVLLFAIDDTTASVARRLLPTMDRTRKLAEITLRDARVPRAALLGESSPRALARTLDRARVALAAEQLGGASRCLDMAVEHAKTRVQFGRPIGSFQAIKHKLADMLLLVESARSAIAYAAHVASRDNDDDDALATAASIAKSYASDAYFACAAESIQIHGGVGFTWEHDAHLYFKRARASAALLGDAGFHRERVAAQILG
jgi:alkylation response protein AidB-like acyl-CoA dehydrogenase